MNLFIKDLIDDTLKATRVRIDDKCENEIFFQGHGMQRCTRKKYIGELCRQCWMDLELNNDINTYEDRETNN